MKQKCPFCKVNLWYDDIEDSDFMDNEDIYKSIWDCHCPKCQRTFTVVEIYSFKEATISEVCDEED